MPLPCSQLARQLLSEQASDNGDKQAGLLARRMCGGQGARTGETVRVCLRVCVCACVRACVQSAQAPAACLIAGQAQQAQRCSSNTQTQDCPPHSLRSALRYIIPEEQQYKQKLQAVTQEAKVQNQASRAGYRAAKGLNLLSTRTTC